MNKRIKELARQAGLNSPYGSDHQGLRDFDYRQFAELIIRECVGVTLDYKNDAHYEGWCDHCAEILTHFGIEQ
jgi:hypothetical protein